MKAMIRALFFCSLFSLSGTAAYSCTCLQISHRKEFRQVDAIFSGRIISKVEDRSYAPPKPKNVSPVFQKHLDSMKRFIIRFEIERRFKGVGGSTVDLYAYESDSPCAGMMFDVGERWLIYAYRKGGAVSPMAACALVLRS